MNEEKIKQLLKRGCSGKINSEAALRELVISQLLEAMGWSFDNGEWYPEAEVQFGSQHHRIDYEVGKDNKKFIIEAKTPGSNLNNNDFIGELLSYMKQKDINYGFLYNGKELLAFKKDSTLPFYDWHCDDNNLEIFNMFSRYNFPDSIDKYIEENKTLKKFKNYINNNPDKIKNEIIRKISELSKTPEDIVNKYLTNILDSLVKNSSDNDNIEEVSEDNDDNCDDANEIRTIFRKELKNLPEKEIVIFPAKLGNNVGLGWVLKYNAWGSVNINKNPGYLALYIVSPVMAIMYFTEIKEIVNVEDQSKVGTLPDYNPGEGKKIILLKPESIVKLADPIGRGKKIHGLRTLMYTNMQKFVNALTLDDL